MNSIFKQDTETKFWDGLSFAALSYFFGLLWVFALWVFGFDWVAALRDASRSTSPEAGLISNVGILLTFGSGIAACVAAFGLKLRFVLLALFLIVFASDDWLMLHETSGREKTLFLGYGIWALAIYSLWALNARKILIWPLLFCGLAFVTSIVVDLRWVSVLMTLGLDSLIEFKSLRYLFEDVPKFAGIIVLANFTLRESWSEITSRRTR